jgi:hypothetical protein
VSVEEFDHDDRGYRTWLAKHNGGYVVNIDPRDKTGTRLHVASCTYIQGPLQRGQHLTESFPKACSTKSEELAPYWRGGRKCSRCVPS